MNPINQFIKDLKKQNKEEEHRSQKEKIIEDINSMINKYEHLEHRIIKNKDEARRKIAQKLKEHDKYKFNPLISLVLSEIIQESTTEMKSVGGGSV